MQVGLIGLGKMGFNLALNFKRHQHDVIAFDVSKSAMERIRSEGIPTAASVGELSESLSGRRVIWLMVPAGNAVDVILGNLKNHLKADDITSLTAHVHQGALDVLGPVTDPQTIHQSKFSMGFVLALIASGGRAGLADFTDAALRDRSLRAFHDRVNMVLDPEIDAAYPKRWLGRVSVKSRDGRLLEKRIASPKGDPDNVLSRPELEDKAIRLAGYTGGATEAQMRAVIARVWALHDAPDVRHFMAA